MIANADRTVDVRRDPRCLSSNRFVSLKRLSAIASLLLVAVCCRPSVLVAADKASTSASSWEPSVTRAIDGILIAALKKRDLNPAPQADDVTLVRRLYLDVLGRIPTPTETQAYLDDATGDKQHRLIDALLGHDEFPLYWRGVWNGWLNGYTAERPFGMDGFLSYLETSLREDRGWDRIATELLLPDVNDDVGRGAAFFLASRVANGDRNAQIDSMTTAVASAFFGVQLQCAKCHDHPLVDAWKQQHYYGLAAFLGRTYQARFKDAPIVSERPEGDVKYLTTKHEERVAELMFLDGRLIAEPKLGKDAVEKGQNGLPDTPKFSRRQALVETAIRPDSHFFKRALVNRVWKQLLGVGLVEPVDQMHEANPATHPEVLDLLANDFAAQGFRVRRLMSHILHSDSYLRSSRWEGSARPADGTYAVAVLKPLTPDQLTLSIAAATGYLEVLKQKYGREKNNSKQAQESPRLRLLREREATELSNRFHTEGGGYSANVGQALYLTYNPWMQTMRRSTPGTLMASLIAEKDAAVAVRQAYLQVLSRQPAEDELETAQSFVTSEKDRAAAFQDLIWALLCGSEFRFNH